MFFHFLIPVLVASTARAAVESQGVVMISIGDITAQHSDGQKIKAKVGQPVFVGDTIISGVDSRSKLVMNDRNVIKIGPNTVLKIEKYVQGSSKSAGNVELHLEAGKVRNDVEQKYDGKDSKFIIVTPTAVAGVRGTQFVTSFDPETQETEVVTLRGEVSMAPPGARIFGAQSEVVVKRGQVSKVAPGAAPSVPKIVPPEQLKTIDKGSQVSAQSRSKDTHGPVTALDPKPKIDKKADIVLGDKTHTPGKRQAGAASESDSRTLVDDALRNQPAAAAATGRAGTVPVTIQPQSKAQ